MMLNPTDIVNVVVTTKPQRIFVVVNDVLHAGKWRTVNPGENGVTPAIGSNKKLLNAALCHWGGQTHYTTTIKELVDSSGGLRSRVKN